ncbi:BTAD domain-containing putative transcriptional regulator [Catenulispora subtropica]|uniref:Bacterial transcriptional activator domain-containing protein n=1 Tax=Catenulispora subtropica TaxID=450798 RepID=A0ABN2SQW9_9ACTN
MTTNRIVRSAAAGAALLGSIAGLPYLLLSYVGNPIPSTMPSPARFVWWLRSGQFDDHAAVAILAYVLWACWAVFTVQVAVQLPGVLRAAWCVRGGGVAEPRTRSLLTGGAAQALLAALLITLLAPRAALAATGKAAASGPMSARPVAVATQFPGDSMTTGTETTGERVHMVVPGDTLWDIAALHLGDPERWPEIYAQNVGLPQPDGQVLTNPDVILPGWQLSMPVVTSGRGAPVSPPPLHGHVPSQQSARSADSLRTASESKRVAPRDRVAVDLGADGYVGIGLAAGIAAALTVSRLRRRARGRCNFPIPLDTQSDERVSGTLAELERAHLLTLAPPDHGYIQDEDDPYLTEWVAAEQPVPVHRPTDNYGLPMLRAASEQELVATRRALEAPTSLSWGTSAGGRPVAFPVDDDMANGMAVEGDGAEAALRALIVAASATEGVPECGTATRVITTAAVMKRIFGAVELPHVPRLRINEDVDSVLDVVEDEVAERRSLLRTLGLRNAAEVRRFKPDHLMQPLLLVVQPSQEHAVRLTDVIEAGRGLDINAVVLGAFGEGSALTVAADGGAAFPGEHTSVLDGARLFHLSAEAAHDALNEIFCHGPVTESSPDPVPEMPTQRTPERAPTLTRDRELLPPVRLEVFDGLGVVVDGNDMIGRFRARLRTLMSYLAVHRDGATRPYLLEEICALEVTEKTRRKLSTELNEIRKILRDAVPAVADAMILDDDPRTQRLRFDATIVTTDMELFTRLLADANSACEADRVELLTEAIRLYRGPVLPTMDADWIEPVREQQRRHALDAHHELVRLIETEDPTYAIHLLGQALDVDPFNIEAHQRLMSSYGAMGNRNKVRQVFELLDYRMGQLDDEVDVESRKLYEQITGGMSVAER